MRFTENDIEDALTIVRRVVPPTPAYAWPLLAKETGVEVIVKHENHTPTGSFKARGGLVFVDALRRAGLPKGLITATRGNHGQSIAIGAEQAGIPSVIVVPEGNSREKNAAMEAFGGELLISGRDFDAARRVAASEASRRGFLNVSSFSRDIVRGVATYGWELFSQHPDLDAVFVPLGMGSGICSLIAMRDLLGMKADIIGVSAERAPVYAETFQNKRRMIGTQAATFADGMACKEPPEEAVAIVLAGAADVVSVSEDEIAEAIRSLYSATHNVAEGAGAAGYAALARHRDRFKAKKVAVILTGGNIDRDRMAMVLAGQTPPA
ncbi:threonine dehydratase [Pleomorphomonas sp. PLEO]|uniref:threonine dehydratase n=1 Tax=Pleomorphomonas sp. PLEO TaxID=3239306 RepID=UPI00351ED4F1